MAETNTQQTKEELQAANTALWEQLTKRNEQYMLGLDKVLTAANYDEDKRATLYNQMMTELAENQKTGVTARRRTYSSTTRRSTRTLVRLPNCYGWWLIIRLYVRFNIRY